MRRQIAPRTLTALDFALIALSFFRARWTRVPAFRTGRRQHETKTVHLQAIRMSRQYIAKARKAGWRGSITDAVMEGRPC